MPKDSVSPQIMKSEKKKKIERGFNVSPFTFKLPVAAQPITAFWFSTYYYINYQFGTYGMIQLEKSEEGTDVNKSMIICWY